MNEICADISEKNKRTHQNYDKIAHNNPILARSRIVFNLYQEPMVPDHGTKYELNLCTYL